MSYCPECNSKNVLRKYAGFYAEVDENGDDIAANFSDHEADTELTDEGICCDCGCDH